MRNRADAGAALLYLAQQYMADASEAKSWMKTRSLIWVHQNRAFSLSPGVSIRLIHSTD